jgi:hypothetical protein
MARSTTQSLIEIGLLVRAVLLTDGRTDGQAVREQQVTGRVHTPLVARMSSSVQPRNT